LVISSSGVCGCVCKLPDTTKHRRSRTTGEGLDLGSAEYRRALAIMGGNGPRLVTRQLRYRLRHASMTDISPRWRCSSRRARSPHRAATSCWYLHSACDQVACDQVGGLVHGLLCDRTDPLLVGVGSDGECARPNISCYRSSGHPGGGRPRTQAARALRPVGRRRVEPFQPTGSR
jgi:hypothetical protein